MFTDSMSPLTLFILTWNMGNAKQEGLFEEFEKRKVHELADILAIGLQESTWTTDQQVSINECIVEFDGFFKKYGYIRKEHIRRGQMQLYIYVRKDVTSRVTSAGTGDTNTGYVGVYNKGGLVISLYIDGTRVTFVSTHLAAHEGVKNCATRNFSIASILDGSKTRLSSVWDVSEISDHIFWMGDMNYRTTYSKDVPNDDIVQALITEKKEMQGNPLTKLNEDHSVSLSKNAEEDEDMNPTVKALHDRTYGKIVGQQWKDLLEYDELNREIRDHRILNQFKALQPCWPPTFKRSRHIAFKNHTGVNSGYEISEEPSSDMYVRKYYNKKRMPSFTDRILYRSNQLFQQNLKNIFFESWESVSSSDHKPVTAAFKLETFDKIEKHVRILDGGAPMKISVKNMSAHGLKEMDYNVKVGDKVLGGTSDPYVVISCDPPTLFEKVSKQKYNQVLNGVQSDTIQKNLNPEWTGADLQFNVGTTDLEALEKFCSIKISVFDQDMMSEDDLIGSITIPFRDLINAKRNSESLRVSDHLHLNSEISGKFHADISIVGDLAISDFANESHTVLSSKMTAFQTGCYCIIN